MSNTRIVFLVMAAVALLTTSILSAAGRISDRSLPRPPKLVLKSNHLIINGVLGDYCWQESEENGCIDKLPPTQLTTRAALIATGIETGRTFRFTAPDFSDPANLSYRIIDTQTEITRHRTARNFTIQEDGNYLVVAQAEWKQGNATYTYQIKAD